MNVNTLSHIRELIKKNKPEIVCLVETRADKNIALKFYDKFKRGWNWLARPASGFSRGIIVFLRSMIGLITPIGISRFSIHLVISSHLLDVWILSIVYNGLLIGTQLSLWNELSCISCLNFPSPLLEILIRFAPMLNTKVVVLIIMLTSLDFFNDYIVKNSLPDVKFNGLDFT